MLFAPPPREALPPPAPRVGDLWYPFAPVGDERAQSGPGGPVTEISRQQVEIALGGDGAAIRALVTELTPLIQARVARALLRRRALARGADVRQRLDDLVQDVFVELFRDDGRVLRAWDPARGLGLRGYVGMIAEQRVLATLRRRSRNPWSEELTVDEGRFDDAAGPHDPELDVSSRQELERLFDRLKASLSPLGRDLFQRLILDEEAIASVCAATGMSTAAVQAWSSRLKRLIQGLAAEIVKEREAADEEVKR